MVDSMAARIEASVALDVDDATVVPVVARNRTCAVGEACTGSAILCVV